MIDLYCERLGPDFWAEPVNALTNLGFVLAAWLIWRFAVQKQVQDPGIAVVTAMIASIGVGSFLFHTMATPLTRWLDVLPILVFQLMYIGLYARRVIALHWAVILSMLVIFLAAALYGRQFPEILNGSLIYAPALLVIAGLGIYHYRSRKKARGLLLVAATAFLLSVFFRSIDNAVCSQFALGTHFLWHIFNALVIYLVMRALLVNLVAE
jgi:hypothetical protein